MSYFLLFIVFYLCKLINTFQKAGMNFAVSLPKQVKLVSVLKTPNSGPCLSQGYHHL